MSQFKLMRLDRVLLKTHPVLTERWIQEQIANDPKILGIGGDLILKDKERTQPRAGRLDLLLQDAETGRRYEVEVQLGDTDETHIIRTVEYWDIERKRYPQYDHCAVIVAEQITSRFLNVISLFNGTIPLIAIQMSALGKGDEVALVFTTVLNELSRGLVDEDEAPQPNTDRSYWIAQAGAESIGIADQLLKSIHAFAPEAQLTYKKQYIGLSFNGEPNNFVQIEPKRNHVRVSFRLDQSEPVREQLEASQLDVMSYDKGFRRYRVRLAAPDIDVGANQVLLQDLMKQAYEASR